MGLETGVRKHPRIPVRRAAVIELRAGRAKGRIRARGRLRDVSRGGLAFEAPLPSAARRAMDDALGFSSGSEVVVRVRHEGTLISLPGTIVWSRSGTSADTLEATAGVKLRLDDADARSRRLFETWMLEQEKSLKPEDGTVALEQLEIRMALMVECVRQVLDRLEEGNLHPAEAIRLSHAAEEFQQVCTLSQLYRSRE